LERVEALAIGQPLYREYRFSMDFEGQIVARTYGAIIHQNCARPTDLGFAGTFGSGEPETKP
jgi:hypothetical protein